MQQTELLSAILSPVVEQASTTRAPLPRKSSEWAKWGCIDLKCCAVHFFEKNPRVKWDYGKGWNKAVDPPPAGVGGLPPYPPSSIRKKGFGIENAFHCSATRFLLGPTCPLMFRFNCLKCTPIFIYRFNAYIFIFKENKLAGCHVEENTHVTKKN